MTRADLLEKLRALKPWLEEQGIVNVRLFGSYARDEAGPDSDVDLLVDLSRPMGIRFLTIERLLSERLEKPVEFCSWEIMRPHVRAKVEKDLILV
ncbi:MAG: nucleotidyltransferase [Brevundimonas sp.]|jgi:predicted nucleotidyltransferase|uniref:Nucleotidyltransferase domain-containing protein n=1 Tax=Brevundimonas albigilva TaxID=1312364 RepID=A0ABY4SJ07_9CAUL|nr:MULTISPECIES: nucleotidyltransferase domain-containing protein [Brevundimonas]MCV0415877.1 nucleotidyltransferase domain-containing protein [Brevundimonas sp.]PZU60740.1 MAG: nucleotidyltransferase [Brevundimonas sp.]UQV17882.1 nucleotidyltransferase domain-containing protein [Brevundimonas albigilva]URI14203.1 nucleotidyltransferase domain-containing protein [Brevundimonas albigilva]